MNSRIEQASLIALAAGLLFVTSARSAPVEIGTFGPTTDISPYLERLNKPASISQNVPNGPVALQTIAHDRYPIVTANMRPGTVKSKRRQQPGAFRPLCILGNDDLSFSWAYRRCEKLKAIGATCLMVQAKDKSELERMQQALHGVPVFAASGDDLVRTLGLTHYPVLLTPGSIEQ